MFSKIVLVISLLFFLVEGAEYKVVSNNLRSKLSKEEKIKAVTRMKDHIASITGKGKASNKDKVSNSKKIEEIKKLEAWEPYDSAYSSVMWLSYVYYSGGACLMSVPTSQYDSFESVCYVGTITGSNNMTYESAQVLFNSACSMQTMAFYAIDDCSGTPTQQGSTSATFVGTQGDCMTYDTDYGTQDSSKSYCTTSAVAWEGMPGLVSTEYHQTKTCSGDASGYQYVAAGCYQDGDMSSALYSEGPKYTTYETSIDCTGPAGMVISHSGCTEDDDYDDYDDDLVNDDMITFIVMDTDTSTSYAWSGSSMGAVLNYSLSAALVLMSCTLFF